MSSTGGGMHPQKSIPHQNSGELARYSKRKFAVPEGGKWFYTQAPMLQVRAETEGFAVAWDTGEDGSKCYGLYPDAEEFYKSLLLLPPDQRCGYELIPETSMCKLYCDIEWVGPQDKSHKKLRWILGELSKHCQDYFQNTHKLHVSCGSRENKDGTFKNSYHVVSPTAIFENNHNGKMKRFFEKLCVGDKWYMDEKKEKCIVDLKVYTKNRLFRPPHCCKKGTSVPLVPIREDAFHLVNFGSSYEPENPEGWRPFILTEIATEGDVTEIATEGDVLQVQVPSPSLGTKNKSRGEAPEGVERKRSKHTTHDDTCPIPLDQIDQVLSSFGDTASKATWAVKVQGEDPTWKVQCNHGGKTRACLHDNGKAHKKNNCLIFLNKIEPRKVLAKYYCTSSSCCTKKRHRVLGVFRLQQNKWVFDKCEASDSDASDVPDDHGNGCEELSAERNDEESMEDVGEVLEKESNEDVYEREDGGASEAEDGEACEQGDREASEAEDGDECEEGDQEASEGEDGDACEEGDREASEAEDGDECQEENSDGGRQGNRAKASRKRRPRGEKEAPLKTGYPDPEAKTYRKVKKRFEKECFRVREPFVYIRLERRDGICRPTQFRHAELKHFYIDWHYWEYDKNKDKWVKKRFIDAWLEDPDKREVYTIAVDPQGKQEDVYNMWTGFKASRLTASDYFKDVEDVEAFVMEPIIHHFDHVITGGNRQHTEYLLDWMANQVQRPWQKTQSLLFLYGKQGCGKDIIFDWYREEVLGPDHTFQTADPERDLFSRFSDGLINRAFVQVDEVKSLHDHMDKLKNAVTSKTLTWEQKHGKIVTVNNICNLLFTSNNVNALTIPTDDRRLVFFRCDPKYKDNKQYFQGLSNHLHTPGVSAWFFQFLNNRDLSKYPYDFQASRPITEYYKESQQATIPQEMRYLSALVNSQVEKEWGGSELYNHYSEWAKSEGINQTFIKSNPMFSKEIQTVDGVKHRRSGGIKYLFNKQKIKCSLKQSGEYCVNACFHVEKH